MTAFSVNSLSLVLASLELLLLAILACCFSALSGGHANRSRCCWHPASQFTLQPGWIPAGSTLSLPHSAALRGRDWFVKTEIERL